MLNDYLPPIESPLRRSSGCWRSFRMHCRRSLSFTLDMSVPEGSSRFWPARGLWAALALVSFFVPMAAHAQYRASIQGVVTDPQGAVIPGAALSLTDVSTNLTLTAKSDGRGNYNFNALPANSFSLTITAQGFSGKTMTGVTLIPEQPNTINIQLAVGSTSENVTVNAGEVPGLDTATASISGTITSNQIQHLPSFGRDVLRLIALAPGTFGDESQSSSGNANNMPGENQAAPQASDGIFKTENNPQVIGNGGQLNTNNILIDGISTSSANWGGASFITPTEDSVEYMKVTSNAYDAEFGRFSGNAVQITSKSGTNYYHGSLFFKVDRPGLNAYQRWNGQASDDPLNAAKTATGRGLAKDTQRFNQFGGSVGGPLLHNKLFAFFAYETLRNNTTVTGSGLYETPAFLGDGPTGSNAARYLTYTGEGVSATGQIVSSCSVALGIADGPYCKTINGAFDVGSPLKTPLGSYDTSYTSTLKPGVGSGLDGVADLQEVATTSPTQRVASQYNGRMDGDVTQKDRVSFVVYWVPLSNISYNGPVRAANLFNQAQVNNAFTVLENHTFSPTLLNEARASTGGWRWNEITSNPQDPLGLAQDTFIGVAPTEPNYFGPPSPSVFNQWTYGYQDIATKVAGRHNIKAGATLSHIEFLNESVSNARPAFTFESLWDFVNDAPYGETGNFNPVTGVPALNRQDDRENIFGAFVQDDFKVSSTLTVNLGIRWNYFGPLYSKQNNLSIVTPGAGAALLTGLTMTQGGNLNTVQKGNFGPQMGFAWNPDYYQRRLVVRGGVGINYNENEFAITTQGGSNSPEVLSFAQTGYSSKNPNIQYILPTSPTSVFGYPPNPHAITTFGTNNLPTSTTVSVTGFDQHVKTITVYHYSLDTELALPDNFVATLGYQGSSGHHLLYQENLNAVAVVRGYPLNPSLTGVGFYTNGANSNYNALLATMKHNFARSFQVEGQYTWSKSMDEGSSPYYQDAYAPISVHLAYGRSDYNVQNAFRVFGLYQPNFFHERWLHSFADGWSLGGIYNWHSGFPWTPNFPVTTTGVIGGPSADLYYKGSPFTSIRAASYTGTGLSSHSTAAFESGPTPSSPVAKNSNFPLGVGGESYFTAPLYNAVATSAAFSPANVASAPGPAMERNTFTGPMYQDFDASLTKGFNIPEMRVIGDKARIEFRADAFNLFNLTNLSGSPQSGITNTLFGANNAALGSRTIELQSRFSF